MSEPIRDIFITIGVMAVILLVIFLVTFLYVKIIPDKEEQFKKEQFVQLKRKINLYYGLCGYKVDTIEIPVDDYFCNK